MMVYGGGLTSHTKSSYTKYFRNRNILQHNITKSNIFVVPFIGIFFINKKKYIKKNPFIGIEPLKA